MHISKKPQSLPRSYRSLQVQPLPADDARQESPASQPERRAGRSDDDPVRWRDFRLAMRASGFALAVIIGSQGLLYSAILDLQGEMNTQFNDLRADMQAQFVHLRESLARIETRLDIAAEPAGDLDG